MSTMILLQEHEGKKAGEQVSVPFGRGRDMLKAGIAAYPASATPPNSKSPSSTAKLEAPDAKAIQAVKDEAISALKAIKAEHEAEVAGFIADTKSAMDLADKATAENAELKKRIAELEKSLAEKAKK